jgi:hypothetical protein
MRTLKYAMAFCSDSRNVGRAVLVWDGCCYFYGSDFLYFAAGGCDGDFEEEL